MGPEEQGQHAGEKQWSPALTRLFFICRANMDGRQQTGN